MARRILILWGMMSLLNLAALAARPASPDGVWEGLDAVPAEKQKLKAWVRPPQARPVKLHKAALGRILLRIQPEGGKPTELRVPMPDGSFARFAITESPVMAPELAARYPEIKTYAGRGVDDPAATIRLDWTPAGFHAQVLSPRGAVYVDPYSQGDDEHYTSYYKRDYRKDPDGWVCLTRGEAAAGEPAVATGLTAERAGTVLRTYRLACAATGEYTAYHGGTVLAGMAAIVTAINRVTGVYENELSIRLVLVANNDLLVCTNAATDPYTNNNGSTMLGQNQTTCDAVIGSANYDIGHVFSTGGGGIAYLGSVCKANKAGGVTGLTAPTGDAFYIDYVAHEMGHQFGANHTFNSITSSCGGGNRNASTAYEPGSGTTIMAYAGICGADNVQSHSDPYFHSVSFDEIIAYISGGGNCAVTTATGNTVPSISAGADYTIPANTPFRLRATGSDADGDALTYCWEERDLGVAQALIDPDNGTSPLFRSFHPTNVTTRIFPKLSAILNNTNSLAERLPTTTRALNFRVTARDNRPAGGGVNTDDMLVNVTSAAGPFLLTHPNSSMTISGLVTVTWNVAGTTAAPVNTANVNILLSTNGGLSFTTMLSSNTPNDGAQNIVLPNINSTQARVMVEATDNIFFDVSNANFTIVPGPPTPLINSAGYALAAESCLPANNAVDPAETVTLHFGLQNLGSANTTNLVATLLPVGGVTSPTDPQTYGVLTAGAVAVSRSFSLVATGNCGGSVTAVLQLQDGPTDHGLITNIFRLGAANTRHFTTTNLAAIAIPGSGNKGVGAPYPSTINVSDVTGTVTKVTATLLGFSHTYPDDVDILLISPTGQKIMLMSDAGGGADLAVVDLTFSAEGSTLPDATAITAGTYQPADYEAGDIMSAPAPGGPYGTALAALNGQNPNGIWSLYIEDDSSKDTGNLAGGWRLNITTSDLVCCEPVIATNHPPFITAAAIGPVSPTTTNALVAIVTAASDPDGDTIAFAYQWQQAGTNLTQTGEALPASATLAGLTYRCIITPSDNQTNGTPFFTEEILVAADADGDEMNDDWEIAFFGSMAAAPGDDADGDGFTNAQEFLAGTDPKAAADALRITDIQPGVALTFTSVAGKSYNVEFRNNLLTGTWESLTNNITGTGGPLTVNDPDAPGQAQRFYRIILVP